MPGGYERIRFLHSYIANGTLGIGNTLSINEIQSVFGTMELEIGSRDLQCMRIVLFR